MYQHIADTITGEIWTTHIKRLSDGALIPTPSDYPDYQEYLAWLAEGNEPLPAPEPEPVPEPTPEQKLASAGLTVEDLRQLLGLEVTP